MELTKTKFKHTEVGLIPEDWILLNVSDVMSFSGGSQPPRHTFRFSVKKGFVRLIQIRDYKSDKYETYIPIELANKICTKDDIMIGRYGPPIFQILRGIDGAYNVALIKVLPKDCLNKCYAYYFLKQQKLYDFVEKLSQRSSGQTGVDLQQLKAYKIPLPPTLAEQKAIATALSDVDELIANLEKLIEKKKAIKQGAMQQLLTPKDDWKIIKLVEAIEMVIDNRGKTPPLQNFGVPLLEVNAIYKQGKFPNLDKVSKYVHKRTFQTWFRNGHPKKGDILIVTVGSAGYTSWVNNAKFCIAQNLISVRIKSSFCSEFVYYLTKTVKFERLVKSVLMGAVQPSLKVPHINHFEFAIPPIQIQKEISQYLSNMDDEIYSLDLKKTKFISIKQGMMQELLTGRTRFI